MPPSREPIDGNVPPMPEIRFPAMLISQAGWHKVADEASELFDASPKDDLIDWQRAEVLDASGRRFRAKAAFRRWPRSMLGAVLCRISGNCIVVGLEIESCEHMPLSEFVSRVGQFEELPSEVDWQSHGQVMEYVCS